MLSLHFRLEANILAANMFPTAEAIREGVQIVEEDEWEEEEEEGQPAVPTDSEPPPESLFPRPPSAEGSFGASFRLHYGISTRTSA